MTRGVYALLSDQADYQFGFRVVDAAVADPVWEIVMAETEHDIDDIILDLVIDTRHWSREALR